MSDIINIEELKRVKEIRERYEKERQTIEYEIQRLQGQLDILNYYLGSDLNNEWHTKRTLTTEQIQNIYKDFMVNYDPNKYKD